MFQIIISIKLDNYNMYGLIIQCKTAFVEEMPNFDSPLSDGIPFVAGSTKLKDETLITSFTTPTSLLDPYSLYMENLDPTIKRKRKKKAAEIPRWGSTN